MYILRLRFRIVSNSVGGFGIELKLKPSVETISKIQIIPLSSTVSVPWHASQV